MLISYKTPTEPNLEYAIYMYKEDLTYKGWYSTKPNQTKPNQIYLIHLYEEDLALNNL